VQVVDLGMKEAANCRVLQQCANCLEQRVPAQHEAGYRLHARGSARGLQREGDACATFRTVLGPDAAALRLDEALGDRESKARAVGAARWVGAPEVLEHPLDGLFGEA